MVSITSRTLVSGLLAAALGTVGVLALQAAGSAGGIPPGSTQLGAGRGAGLVHRGTGLPAHSGTGERVVYSLSGGRVWLVGPSGAVVRTFPVTGSAPLPALGTHKVFARRIAGRGGDGTDVEHVVLFARTGDTNIGFSATANGSAAPPAPARRTGAIRATRADAEAVWERAMIDALVVVVP